MANQGPLENAYEAAMNAQDRELERHRTGTVVVQDEGNARQVDAEPDGARRGLQRHASDARHQPCGTSTGATMLLLIV